MIEEPSVAPWSTTRVAASTQDQDAYRRSALRADLAALLAWIRETVGPDRWSSSISLRMARQPARSPESIASRIAEVLVELDPDTLRLLLGMLDEMVDDLVMSRPHRRMLRPEAAALEELREALARV